MAKYETASPIVLQALEEGHLQKDAAEKAGINIDTFHTWMKDKPEFSEAVKRAKENAQTNAINAVERSLLDLAKGYEYEEVRTEYESKRNPDTGKYKPVVKKQVRTKKHFPPSTEAIKFLLTNKAPDEWKNRIEQTNRGSLTTSLNIRYVGNVGDDEFPSSEAQVEEQIQQEREA